MKTVANIMQLIVQNKLFKEKITFLKSVLNIFDQISYILLKNTEFSLQILNIVKRVCEIKGFCISLD